MVLGLGKEIWKGEGGEELLWMTCWPPKSKVMSGLRLWPWYRSWFEALEGTKGAGVDVCGPYAGACGLGCHLRPCWYPWALLLRGSCQYSQKLYWCPWPLLPPKTTWMPRAAGPNWFGLSLLEFERIFPSPSLLLTTFLGSISQLLYIVLNEKHLDVPVTLFDIDSTTLCGLSTIRCQWNGKYLMNTYIHPSINCSRKWFLCKRGKEKEVDDHKRGRERGGENILF